MKTEITPLIANAGTDTRQGRCGIDVRCSFLSTTGNSHSQLGSCAGTAAVGRPQVQICTAKFAKMLLTRPQLPRSVSEVYVLSETYQVCEAMYRSDSCLESRVCVSSSCESRYL